MKHLMKRCVGVTLGMLLFSSGSIYAEGMDIFGYSQITLVGTKDLEHSDLKPKLNASVQELDIFLQKTISPKISTLVDLQFTGNYSTTKSWGNMALEEAWVKFSPSRLLNIKVGKVLPIFNNFNEIKSRFPLFPYIIRPIVYETSYQESLSLNRWVPEHAMFQIYGSHRVSKAILDYALFAGNSEFIKNRLTSSSGLDLPGDDTTSFKLVGGRVGVRSNGIKFGASGTYDNTRSDVINNSVADQNVMLAGINEHLPTGVPQIPAIPYLGAIPRARLGFDLSYTGHGLTVESEYILIKEMPSDAEKANLDMIVSGTTIPAGIMGPNAIKTIGTDLTKTFWYVNVMYDFMEKYYTSVGMSVQTDASDLMVTKDGVVGLLFCFGYRLSDEVTIKSEFTNIRNDLMSKDAHLVLNMIIPQLAVSVFF